MKKKSILLVLLAMVLASSMFMTACGGKGGESEEEPMTLEKYAAGDEEIQKSIDEAASGSDVIVDITENDIVYSFDLSKMEGYTEEVAKSDEIKKALESALDGAGETFGGIAKTIQDATGIDGIKTIVNYTWGDEMLVTKTFTAADAASDSSEDSEE